MYIYLFSVSIYFFIIAEFKIINHPVHIIDDGGHLSPSAFIPFCGFGENLTATGSKIDIIDLPICTSFQAKVLNDQLCYEIDLNKFSDKNNIDKQIRSGFFFMMDYNEDRQITFEQDNDAQKEDFVSKAIKSLDNGQAHIFLNTKGLIKSVHV